MTAPTTTSLTLLLTSVGTTTTEVADEPLPVVKSETPPWEEALKQVPMLRRITPKKEYELHSEKFGKDPNDQFTRVASSEIFNN